MAYLYLRRTFFFFHQSVTSYARLSHQSEERWYFSQEENVNELPSENTAAQAETKRPQTCLLSAGLLLHIPSLKSGGE